MIRTLVPERHAATALRGEGRFPPTSASHLRPPYQWGSKRTGPDLAREGGTLAVAPNTCASASAATTGTSTTSSIPRQTLPAPNMPAYPGCLKTTRRREIPARQDFRPVPARHPVATHEPA